MTKTYLFYDLETTGLNNAFDQIVQFAAIRTDEKLNELERHEILVSLNPDVVPSPEATITHRTSLKAMQQGIPEYDAIQQIHTIINQPGTVSLGYNTLGFDDEFLRFSFYRHLLPPYTHQYANCCSRSDIFPMTIMYYLFYPEALEWPMKEGKLSLKLEALNEANKLATGEAHTAIVDVEMTVALAKRLKTNPSMWTYIENYFNKKEDTERTYKLPERLDCPFGLYINSSFGARVNFTAPALNLGTHRHYSNQNLWLRLDLPELQQTKPDDIPKNTWVMNKKWGELGFLLPPDDKYLKHVSSDRQTLAEDNLAWLQKHPDIFEAIREHYLHYTYPEIANVDPAAALYINGFPSGEDTRLSQQFHHVDWSLKADIASRFQNDTLKTLAFRIIGHSDPNLLHDEDRDHYQQYIKRCHSNDEPLIDYRANTKLTPQKAFATIEELRRTKTLDEEQKALLKELEIFIKKYC